MRHFSTRIITALALAAAVVFPVQAQTAPQAGATAAAVPPPGPGVGTAGQPAAVATTPQATAEAPVGAAYDRRQRGLAALDTITGGGAARLVESLKDLAPELSDWIIDFAYGDVVGRPQLPLQTRELVTVGALTALGNAQPQLKAHIRGALNAGCTPREVLEVILQMAVYAGFPAALNGLTAAREVFAERQITVTR